MIHPMAAVPLSDKKYTAASTPTDSKGRLLGTPNPSCMTESSPASIPAEVISDAAKMTKRTAGANFLKTRQSVPSNPPYFLPQ